MKLLVIILCLLSERFLIHWMAYRRFSWFADYAVSIKNILAKKHFENPWLIMLALILPIILVVSIVYFSLHTFFWGFLGLILNLILFLYCLGPENIFYPQTDPEIPSNSVAGNYFADANRQLFALIFWYVLAGPIAALTYRLITLCRQVSPIDQQANVLTDILEWIPARITTLLYLVVGNFQNGFALFVRLFISKPALNNQMLSECGLQAVRKDHSDEVSLSAAEDLVEYALIVLLVFIALFTLIAWL